MLSLLPVLSLVLAAPPQGRPLVPGTTIERVSCPSDPAETYTLYLPSAYDPARRWPLLLVFDPRGRGTAAAEVFRDAAETFGWIVVSSDNTRSDGPWEPNRRALAALWPDVLGAYAVDRRRVYAAGFSGGATVAWTLARSVGTLAGIIATGAPALPDVSAPARRLAWFSAAGRTDFNFLDARELDERMARAGVPHRLEFFDGPHQWMTSDVARLAVGWLEAVAMNDGLRPRDEALVARVVADETARAARLESSGRIVDARRALASIVESYGALTDVTAVVRHARELDADGRLPCARKAEQRNDDGERAQVAAFQQVLGRLGGDETFYARQLVTMLKIDALHKAARRTGYEGESAQRVLERIFVRTSSYLPQEFAEKREFALAALSLEVAAAIHPDRPVVWVNLAGAQALAGSRKPAIAALEKAIDAGFRNGDALARDDRFASLRGTAEFARLLARLAAKPPGDARPPNSKLQTPAGC